MASSSINIYGTIGALLGSTAAVSFVMGEELMDVAFTFNGALGAATGYAVGDAMKESLPEAVQDYACFVGAVAVPALVQGGIDTHILLLGAGAYVGGYLFTKYGDVELKTE